MKESSALSDNHTTAPGNQNNKETENKSDIVTGGECQPEKVKKIAQPVKTRKIPAMAAKIGPPKHDPDDLIRKLDKKVEKNLRALQGLPAEEPDENDDLEIDEETMDDLLNGDRAKELDQFLRAH